MSLPPVSPSALLDLLMATPDTAIAALPPAAPVQAAQESARSGAVLRRVRQQLGAPVLAAGRAVLRRPNVRQLALRILKRFPGLYARAYRMMLAPGAAPARPDAPVQRAAPPPRAPGARPRLAMVSPLPPERTGVATYTVELLEQLMASFDIDLVLAQAEVVLPPALAGLPQRTVAWFAEHGEEYDQVLYQIGNSPYHSHMFALLARHPGVVVLHDFFLGGALAHAQMSGALPRAWADALFHAHGYGAVRASEDPLHSAHAHRDWPCTLGVLETATRVIVHSRHARQLAADWFGEAAAQQIDVIPLPRAAPPVLDRKAARAALGIADDCFLVCSFGFVAPNKLTQELLRAWCASTLHADPACSLVLVGANHDSPYGVQVEELIRAAGPAANIRIAGWTDESVYRLYLQAADLGVQLRTNARGESSAAVLDCLNYGLPTIVNANGSLAEFPPDAVWRLQDAFTLPELTGALETLRESPARRQALGQSAVALFNAQFRPDQCTRHYLETLARATSHTARTYRRQLFIDVTAPDALASKQLRELLAAQRPGLRIVPVSLDTRGAAPCYREATNATGRLLGLGWPVQPEPAVEAQPGDIFYAPDADAPSVAAAAGLLAAWRARGVTINLLVRTGDATAHPRSAAADRLLVPQASMTERTISV